MSSYQKLQNDIQRLAQIAKDNNWIIMMPSQRKQTVPDAYLLLKQMYELWNKYDIFHLIIVEEDDEKIVDTVYAALHDTQTKAEMLIRGLEQAKETMALFEDLFGQEKFVSMASLDYDAMIEDVKEWTR